MKANSRLPSHRKLADFHLLLYLSKLPSFNLEEDVNIMTAAVKHQGKIPEGYMLIIESI